MILKPEETGREAPPTTGPKGTGPGDKALPIWVSVRLSLATQWLAQKGFCEGLRGKVRTWGQRDSRRGYQLSGRRGQIIVPKRIILELGRQRGRRGWNEWRVALTYIHSHVNTGSPPGALWWPRRMAGGSRGEDICIRRADSRCWMAETNTL